MKDTNGLGTVKKRQVCFKHVCYNFIYINISLYMHINMKDFFKQQLSLGGRTIRNFSFLCKRIFYQTYIREVLGSPGVKNPPPPNAGDMSLIPSPGRFQMPCSHTTTAEPKHCHQREAPTCCNQRKAVHSNEDPGEAKNE